MVSRRTVDRVPIASERAITRLLDDSGRTGVRPDSVQVIGGPLSMRLPTRLGCGSFSGCVLVDCRVEVWLKRGLPSSQ